MPREASQCKNWEKERRDRLNKCFEELAKVLPSYDPSITISKIEILKQAHANIIELKEEISVLASSTLENKSFKDEQIKKLRERIKKLLTRNEQLNNLFRDAGIKAPRIVGTVKQFKKLGKYSNRTTQQQANILQKKEIEKENALSTGLKSKLKRNRVSTNQAKCNKMKNSSVKIQKPKKVNKKKQPISNSLLVLSQVPTVPAINQQLVFVRNAPLQNISRKSTVLTVTSAKSATTQATTTKLAPVKLTPSNLGPGTLILGNGNIISLLPQPQIMIPPMSLPSQTVAISKLGKKKKTHVTINNNSKIKNSTLIRPKRCVTNTTQINKVPIPALTSKYANTSALLKNSVKLNKKNEIKKSTKVIENSSLMGTKRKFCENPETEVKKKRMGDADNKETTTESSDKLNENIETEKSDSNENKETSIGPKINSVAAAVETTSTNLVANEASRNPSEECVNVTRTEMKGTKPKTIAEEKIVAPEEIHEKLEDVGVLSSNNQISEKPDESSSTVKSFIEKEISEKSYKSNLDMSTTCTTAESSTSTATINIPAQDEAIKNIDLNLVHSDLSNDIFASLQVPPGCQNTESTSPTAAFLLAFPLVSSIKVTEVIDEENSDSQRETPTLLQIGSMNTSKPNHNDNLLNLDNFPFFNSKDICSSYYNPKVEPNSHNLNPENSKNSETASMDLLAQDSKIENETFNIFAENNRQTKEILSNANNFKAFELFPKPETHILENKTKSSQKPNVTQHKDNHTRSIVNNEQFILYEEKNKENESNFPVPGSEIAQLVQNNRVHRKIPDSSTYNEAAPDAVQTTCNVLSSDINTNFGIPLQQPSVSTSNNYNLSDSTLYKNYKNHCEKDVQQQQLNSRNTISNIQYTFNANNNKDINNEFKSNSKIIPSNPQKQFVSKEQNLNFSYHTFSSNSLKNSELSLNLENCSNKTNTKMNDVYHPYNPFEVPMKSKEISFNVADDCNKHSNNVAKESHMKATDSTKKMPEIYNKTVDAKTPCYFSSNYSNTVTPSYKSDFSKPCTYENQKSYSNTFYTNCNYNYSDTNINQNYYKSDAKPSYSLSYENYHEYRKTDTSLCNTGNFTRDRKNVAVKEKPMTQNKPVNWMTEQKSQPSDCFLPSFTSQSYSFTSCISTDTNDNNNNTTELKKTADLADKNFSWSPTKLPNFLEPAHNFITSTLPTLVGDLALGNSVPVNDTKAEYKYSKESKKKTCDNQANFLSVSQLVNQSKTDVPARTITRRLSGSKSKMNVTKPKRFDKNVEKSTGKPVNNLDLFYEQKNRNPNKNVLSNYSAEALIGNNQGPQEAKKGTDNSTKSVCSSNFFAENIVPYFTTVDDGFINQNQNFHNTYNTHNSFQNNSYPGNSFIYSSPSISSSYLSSNFEGTHDYSSQSVMNYCGLKDNKNFSNKNYRITNKEEKNGSYSSNVKKTKKINQSNNSGLGNFEYPLLPIQGSTNSPVLPDDFQAHTFLPPTAPYACKNSLYQKQGNEFNSSSLLPLPGITKNNIQHPQVSPSLNAVGTSLTNFNLSTIFPEINKGTIPNAHSSANKSKNNSNFMEGTFNADSKYGFSG